MSELRVILSTAGNKQEAEALAWALVERKLAACVNLVPVTSVFRWKGELEQTPEFLLLIKTTRSACARVAETVRELSSYELPECIELSIEGGSEAYLNWLEQCVGPV